MRSVRLQNDNGDQVAGKEGRSRDTGEFLYKVIENSGGVPFQLIFGQKPAEGHYVDIGAGIVQLLGVGPDDFTEKVFTSMIEEIVPLNEEKPADMPDFRNKFSSGEIRSYKAEILVKTADGERKWIRYASLPLIDEETGKVIGASGILYDITGRRLSPDRIKEKEDEWDRLKTDLIHNLAHEIRTPLNAIIGFSTLLGEELEIPERRKEYLDIIVRNSDHLLAIIDDIVEISKIDAKMVKIRRDKVKLNSVLRKIYDQFGSEASGKGLLLRFEPEHDTGDAFVYTDWYKLTEVLRNLVENAMKFTHQGRIEFGYSVKDGMIEFFVSDTGTGIPSEQHRRIFSRFFQGDSSLSRIHGGTGLGLAIAKAYVELMGGQIWFTSQSGEGSVFRFTLPYERVEKMQI